jgi:hypothetical protein
MSREFSKISPRVWRSARFRALDSDDDRYLLLFLMTCSHQTSAGCFRMPEAYGAADLGWHPDRMRDARNALVAAGLIEFDGTTDEYFVCGWLRHNRPMNASHQKAIERAIAELESDAVRNVAETDLEAARLPNTSPTVSRSDASIAAALERRAAKRA